MARNFILDFQSGNESHSDAFRVQDRDAPPRVGRTIRCLRHRRSGIYSLSRILAGSFCDRMIVGLSLFLFKSWRVLSTDMPSDHANRLSMVSCELVFFRQNIHYRRCPLPGNLISPIEYHYRCGSAAASVMSRATISVSTCMYIPLYKPSNHPLSHSCAYNAFLHRPPYPRLHYLRPRRLRVHHQAR